MKVAILDDWFDMLWTPECFEGGREGGLVAECEVLSLHLRLVPVTCGIVTDRRHGASEADRAARQHEPCRPIEPGAFVAALRSGRPGMKVVNPVD